MAGETVRIAEIAERISKEIFTFFRWRSLPTGLMNQNFKCVHKEEHVILKSKQIENIQAEFDQILLNEKKKGASEEDIDALINDQNEKLAEMQKEKKEDLEKMHPVDAVFFYDDPYEKKKVYFNCDLKSYQQSSITTTALRQTLSSLAQTIHCAHDSPEWNKRYHCNFSGEVRGLIFLLNHDGKYKNDIREFFKPKKESDEQQIHIDNLKLQGNQFIHIIDPATICYLDTIRKDTAYLTSINKFPHPKKDWFFYYPDLKLKRPTPDTSISPATIEMILGPFLIMKYKAFESNEDSKMQNEGFLIYYKLSGSCIEEFLFFLDTLSSYQIFKNKINIQIRMINEAPDPMYEENFSNAIETYIENWHLTDHSAEIFREIEFSLVENITDRFLTKAILYREI